MNKLLLAVLAFILCVNLNAQDAAFNTYNFGEGLEFVSEDVEKYWMSVGHDWTF